MSRLSPQRIKLYQDYLDKHPNDNNKNYIRDLARKIWEDPAARKILGDIKFETIRVGLFRYIRTNKVQASKHFTAGESKGDTDTEPLSSLKPKKGLEIRGEHIVINWSTKTVITDLGEYGDIKCSFDMHKAVQRSYVFSGEGETAAIVAMKFDFPHAKAVHKYAKIHGFTKSSLPQTDLEFELGMTVDEAVHENIQTLKRQTYKKTEKEKWKFIQQSADKWLDFHHNVLKPFENFIEAYIPKYTPITYKIPGLHSIKKKRYAAVIGMSDWHFLKLCYSPDGQYLYNKDIARKEIKRHALQLIEEMLLRGRPEKIYLPVGGNDNMHIDNPMHTTTAGTPQINATDGIYIIGMSEYVDISLDFIEMFAKIAPVEAVCFPGNHDENTSQLMGMFFTRMLRDDKRVKVVTSLHPRIYRQYGKVCCIFSHGHHLGSKKLRGEIHKIILGEAKENGINLDEIDYFLLFTGHDHVGSFHDLNGHVQHFVMPSFLRGDDFWHLGKGYMGRAQESAIYTIDPVTGRKGIGYSS